MGHRRVRFNHLSFPHPLRSEDNKIIKQLEKTFASEWPKLVTNGVENQWVDGGSMGGGSIGRGSMGGGSTGGRLFDGG